MDQGKEKVFRIFYLVSLISINMPYIKIFKNHKLTLEMWFQYTDKIEELHIQST